MPNPPQMEFYENANYVPHYQPATDVIRVPKMSRYLNLEDYYNTVFHELTHATGHSKRLDRFSLDANADGLHAYGREELTAAMGSAMLAAHAGIEAGTRRAGRQPHPPLAGHDQRRQAHDHTLRHAGPEGR